VRVDFEMCSGRGTPVRAHPGQHGSRCRAACDRSGDASSWSLRLQWRSALLDRQRLGKLRLQCAVRFGCASCGRTEIPVQARYKSTKGFGLRFPKPLILLVAGAGFEPATFGSPFHIDTSAHARQSTPRKLGSRQSWCWVRLALVGSNFLGAVWVVTNCLRYAEQS